MFKFFDFITNLVEIIWSLVKSSINFAQNIFDLIFKGLAFITGILSQIPPFAQGFITFVLCFSLATVLLGFWLDY